MPTPDLPSSTSMRSRPARKTPKVVEFMSKTVKPEMAKLLNQPEMNESNPKGFGCLECHTLKKK